MPIAFLENIEKLLGPRMIFQGLNLSIERGERVGLIGNNGSGKTTLLRVLTKKLEIDAGVASIQAGARVGLLEQDPRFTPGNTLIDEAELAFEDLHRLAHEMREVEHQMGHLTGEMLEKAMHVYERLSHDFEQAGGYAWRHKLEAALDGVGLARADWEHSVDALSGGQKSRLALAKLLVSAPDLLLLDEPTNHLDLQAVEWLENYLLDFDGAVLIISHDRYLLDRVATRIAWLNQQKIASYPGNYSAFVQQKELHELTQARVYEEQQAEIAKQEEYIRRFQAGQRARQAKGRKSRLERFLDSDQVVAKLSQSKQMHLKLTTDMRAGDQLLRVRELDKSFGEKLIWKDVHFDVTRGQRIGIIGPNGSGKTTLLRTLIGQLDADAGDVRWGSNIQIGYYDQKLDDFDPESTVLDEVMSDLAEPNEKVMRHYLGAMMFGGDDVFKQMKLLSGGERARVALVKLLIKQPNVLLMDEPTNHLDILSCEALENALKEFPGTILCVSHDRFFLDRIVERLFVLDPPALVDFPGPFRAWHEKQKQQAKAQVARQEQKSKPAPTPPPPAKSRDKRDKKENPYLRPFGRHSDQEIEKLMEKTQADIQSCQEKYANPGSFREASQAKKLAEELESLNKKLAQLEAEYLFRLE